MYLIISITGLVVIICIERFIRKHINISYQLKHLQEQHEPSSKRRSNQAQ